VSDFVRRSPDWPDLTVRKLGGKVAYLLAQQGAAAATGPKVDFIVDRFDRTNTVGLGPYWQGLDLGLRNNRAIPANSTSSSASPWQGSDLASQIVNKQVIGIPMLGPGYVYKNTYSSSTYTNGVFVSGVTEYDVICAPFRGLASRDPGTLSTLYQFPISVSDFTIKIVFEGPPSPVIVGDGANFTNYYTVFGASAGAFFAGSLLGQDKLAAVLTGFNLPAIPMPLSPSPAATPMTFVVGDLLGVINRLSTAYDDTIVVADRGTGTPNPIPQSGTFTYTDSTNYAVQFLASSLLPGAPNTLVLSAAGDTYTATLNGKVMYSAPSALVGKRQYAGLCSYAFNLIAQAIQFQLPLTGITSFKAWRTDMQEPPNESGHGTLDATSGKLVYRDKYHTPIFNAPGVIAGYAYNPNA